MKATKYLLLTITLLLTLSLLSCSQPAYTPEGEIYVKTSPAWGDGGVTDVVDMEIEKAVYTADGELTVPVKLGVGHRPNRYDKSDGDGYAYLVISVRYNTMPPGEILEIGRLDFPDYETDKFNSTKPEPDRSILFMPIYGDFYPIYRESVDWDIPADAKNGYMEAVLHTVDSNGNHSDYSNHSPRIYFERIDGELNFYVD